MRPDPGHVWALVVVLCVVVLGAADAVFLDLVKGYFSTGFNTHSVRDLPGLLTFFGAGALLDGFVVLGIWGLLTPFAARAPLSQLQRLALVASLCLALPLLASIAQFQLHQVLGDVLSIGLLLHLAGDSIRSAASEALAQAPPLGVLSAAAAITLLCILWLAGRAERAAPALGSASLPRPRTVWLAAVACGLLGAGALVTAQLGSVRIHFGLNWKASGKLMGQLLNEATDFDRDGYGAFSRPPGDGLTDAAPVGFEPVSPIPLEPIIGEENPPFLLIFLESFRADVVGLRVGGREVTPFLNRLAHEGGSSRHAYVHSPSTWRSRAQLFSGSLVPEPGEDTILDDFLDRGYRVGYFSGQDDAFADGRSFIGWDRAHAFYDARSDLERRSSRSSSPVSLQVSWKVLVPRVREFLEGYDAASPLFLYVNIVDTHFPYNRELDDILGVPPLRRSEIRRDNPQRVWEGYLNAAANVDRAAEQVFDAFRSAVGDARFGVLITADHGQAFYEDGFLGHGQSLDVTQTRVPLILWQIGGSWPEPIGLADVRGLLRRTFFRPGPREPFFEPDPERQVFQYGGLPERPKLLGLRGLRGAAIYDVGRQVIAHEDAAGEVSRRERRPGGPEFAELIWNWEAIRTRVSEEARRGQQILR